MPIEKAVSTISGVAEVSLPATEDVGHVIDWVDWSYSGVGLGTITVEDVDGAGVIYEVDTKDPGPHSMDRTLPGTVGKELRVRLSGIALLKGKLVVSHY